MRHLSGLPQTKQMNKRKRNEQTKYQAEKEKAFKGWAYYTDIKRNDVLGLVWEEEEKKEEKEEEKTEDLN